VVGYNLIYRFTLKEPDIEKFTEFIARTISLESINYRKTKYLLLEAFILNGLKKYDECIDSIDKAIELVPTLLPLYARKAYLLIISKREIEALTLIEELIEKYPSLKRSLLLEKSYIHVMLKQYDEGLRAVDKAIELFPQDTNFVNNKAFILGYLGRKEEAIETADYLISLNPKWGNSYDTYGEILMVFEEYEEAIGKFKEALKLEPSGWFAIETYLKMGECYKNRGEVEKALEFYEKGKKLTEKLHPSHISEYTPKVEKKISELKAFLGESKELE
ncbi:MAG: tetratricopeptide repeat protein, partial [Candidatus Thorarchaeota archaeon]